MPPLRFSCECSQVQYEISGPLPEVLACHCTQCRKSSGHYWASVRVQDDQIKVISDTTLAIYQSTDMAQRGFCTACGSTISWRLQGRPGLLLSAGCFDDDLPVRLTGHHFVTEKGNYYDLKDGLPQAERFDYPADPSPAPSTEEA
ncbi:GFA family protein [Oceanomicrobium pacificus]|uniref:GFA family protein n=1 Tax=Oceanomicrobium pacificus TaxID=2692916 RepID=A0A6B0U4T0_9RHOB|nr:GFA family protein [Oceanomicrobium pacificus]MXU65941.1 GFA family protein [Oceanomicrobium pacificus]